MFKLKGSSVLVGLLVGLLIASATPVVAAVGDAILLGNANRANKRTTVAGAVGSATLKLVNNRAGGAGLAISVETGSAPIRVNSKTRVENLNADYLDGKSARYFATSKAQPNQTHVGAFGAAGDGTFLVHAATFPAPLSRSVPQSRVHYVRPEAGPTADCPGVFQARAGHLCIYATWENGASYNGIGRIDTEFLNSGASRHGFTIIWTGSSSSANVRGSWAYTVPASSDVFVEESVSVGTPTEIGLIPTP